jgi:hypothetical protein
LTKIRFHNLTPDSTELLAEGGGAQSEAEKRELDDTSKHRAEGETKTSFDARSEQLRNFYPKIPDGAASYATSL